MGVAGDSSLWLDFFPNHLMGDVLELLVTCWQSLAKPAPNEHEEPITRRYREALCKEKTARRLPFSIWPESSETELVTGKELGRIDLRFLHGHREDVYLAFECKRLRIPRDSGLDKNTSQYVGEEGMMRHITGKYSKGLSDAGMIAYVMDGDAKQAKTDIRASVARKKLELMLKPNTKLGASRHCPADERVAETQHDLGGRELVIHHLFLAV